MDVSPEPAQDYDELKPERSLIEGLVSDALRSPVFDSSFRPSRVDFDCVPSPQASSFTLVNEQSSKSKRFSSMYKSMQDFCEIDNVAPAEQVLEDMPLLQAPESSASAADLSEDEEVRDYVDYDDDYDGRVGASNEDCALVDSPPLDASFLADGGEELHHDCVPSAETAQPSSSSHTLQDSSLSSYSMQSDRSDISAPRPPPSDSMRSMKSRRATEMSFGSAHNLPSPRDRRFALRRQAIYADYGFQIAFPESDSDSSLRQGPHSPTKAYKKGHAVGGRAASASAYVFSASASGIPRSAWSTSTSGASLKSVADLADAASTPYSGPLPSSGALNLAQANDKLERLSVQDDLLASSRIPFANTDDPGSLRTSTPPLSLKSRSLRLLAQDHSSKTSGVSSAHTARVHGSSRTHTMPWAPLHVVKRDSTDPLVLCVSVSPSDRAERFAIWLDEPGHHPIVEALLGEVRRAMEEWKGIGAVVGYF
ncbi:hypothetical protein C8T65DRAFT_220938 [Cerioporus squamosus]|nr:hypothetical protein C8T65DRAFT_220938 [Cerioporus squamosus]